MSTPETRTPQPEKVPGNGATYLGIVLDVLGALTLILGVIGLINTEGSFGSVVAILIGALLVLIGIGAQVIGHLAAIAHHLATTRLEASAREIADLEDQQ